MGVVLAEAEGVADEVPVAAAEAVGIVVPVDPVVPPVPVLEVADVELVAAAEALAAGEALVKLAGGTMIKTEATTGGVIGLLPLTNCTDRT